MNMKVCPYCGRPLVLKVVTGALMVRDLSTGAVKTDFAFCASCRTYGKDLNRVLVAEVIGA